MGKKVNTRERGASFFLAVTEAEWAQNSGKI